MSAPVATRGDQIVLAVFACAAVAAFGSAFNQPAAWGFWLPVIVSPFWQLRSLPRSVIKWGRFAAWPFLASTLTLGLVLMVYPPLFSPHLTEALTLISGYGLGLSTSMFLLGTHLWSPAETVIPAATGLAVVACFNSLAVITPLLVTPAAAAFVYLLLLKRLPWRRIFSVRLAASALISALIALTLFSQLPRWQQQVETVTMRWLSGEANAANPFGLQSQLGDLERLQLSRRIVLRVWTPQPQKLRARVFARFDGRTWQASVSAMTFLPQSPVPSHGMLLEDIPGNYFVFSRAEAGIPPGAISTRIVQSAANSSVLAAPANKLLARAPVPRLRADRFDNLLLVPALTSEVPIYGVVNLPGAEDAVAGTSTPREEFLGTPADLDPRWRALAMQLAANTSSAAEVVARTIDYVKHAANYSLEVGEFHTRQPMTEFFFEKRRGYCQYFATAAALLLRLEGIPARYVTGYMVQEINSPGGYYVVRDADAHAWVEVLVPGKGWMEADPTPEAEFAARRTANSPGRLAEYAEWLAALAAETWALLSQSDWRDALPALRQALRSVWAVAIIVAAFFLVFGIVLAWTRPRRRRSKHIEAQLAPAKFAEPDERLRSLRETLDRAWHDAGISRPPSRGLLEHVTAIQPEKASAEFLDLSRRLANNYYHLSFGGGELPTDALRELNQLSAQLASEARKTLHEAKR